MKKILKYILSINRDNNNYKIILLQKLWIEKLSFLLSKNIFYLFVLIIFARLLLTYLFYHLLKIVTSKNSFHRTSNYFLQGGMVNQLLPGIGFYISIISLIKN